MANLNLLKILSGGAQGVQQGMALRLAETLRQRQQEEETARRAAEAAQAFENAKGLATHSSELNQNSQMQALLLKLTELIAQQPGASTTNVPPELQPIIGDTQGAASLARETARDTLNEERNYNLQVAGAGQGITLPGMSEQLTALSQGVENLRKNSYSREDTIRREGEKFDIAKIAATNFFSDQRHDKELTAKKEDNLVDIVTTLMKNRSNIQDAMASLPEVSFEGDTRLQDLQAASAEIDRLSGILLPMVLKKYGVTEKSNLFTQEETKQLDSVLQRLNSLEGQVIPESVWRGWFRVSDPARLEKLVTEVKLQQRRK